jgi:hypothetical protein
MWLPTGAARPPIGPQEQLSRAVAARPAEGAVGVVVHASAGEAKIALVRGSQVVHGWILKSPSNIGEVQLAEPYDNGVLVVVRIWTEKQAQFRVVRLTPDGIAQSFAVDRAEWAESASLSRFRLHGHTLYQMRSTPSGVEIATFEIGGTR